MQLSTLSPGRRRTPEHSERYDHVAADLRKCGNQASCEMALPTRRSARASRSKTKGVIAEHQPVTDSYTPSPPSEDVVGRQNQSSALRRLFPMTLLDPDVTMFDPVPTHKPYPAEVVYAIALSDSLRNQKDIEIFTAIEDVADTSNTPAGATDPVLISRSIITTDPPRSSLFGDVQVRRRLSSSRVTVSCDIGAILYTTHCSHKSSATQSDARAALSKIPSCNQKPHHAAITCKIRCRR